jgi:cytoskeleton protein RodZ
MSKLDTQRDFGRYLQARRMKQGISLEAISRLTRITTTCLKQIESEDLANLPAPVFVKGFLRSYAEAVGADTQEVFRRYEAYSQALEQTHHYQSQLDTRTPFLLRIVVALVLLSSLIAATLYIDKTMFSPQSSDSSSTLSILHKDSENPQVSKTDESASVLEKEEMAAEPVKKKALTLRMEAVEPSGIKVISDDQKPQEYNLQVGEAVEIHAESKFSLLISNAAGVRLTLNGKHVTVPGKSGQAVTLELP